MPKVSKLQSPKLRLTQSLLVATLTQNFMRFRCMVMEISSIPNYLVYSIKRLPTPKANKLQSPKLRVTQSPLVAILTQNFMRLHCTVMEISSIPNYLVYSIKRLPTPKVNKLQSPKLRLTQSLLVATFTQNFMRFRCTVMEKRHQNVPPHSSVCDDRYRACTFASTGQTLRPFYSSLEDATTLKQAPFCSFQKGLLHDILFEKFWRGHRFIKFERNQRL